MKLKQLINPALTVILGVTALEAEELKQQFVAQSKWGHFGELKHSDRDLTVVTKGTDLISNLAPTGKTQEADFLQSKEKFNDVHMKLEFMVPKGSNSGVYFMGRYEIQILDSFGRKKVGSADLGGLYQRWDANRNPKGFEGVAPKVNAAKAPGEWQTMEVVFRAPRFAKDGSKTHHAKFIKVLVNDQLVHENQVAKGPTRSSKFGDETAEAESLFIQGDHGPVAIRSIELKKLELSTSGEKPLEGAEAAPLDDEGRPLINSIAYGKEVYDTKGCMVCHSTVKGEIKTGPSFHGLFTLKGRDVKVLEVDEGHKKSLPADIEYLKFSLRRPLEALTLKEDGTPYPSLMPTYNYKLINDDEVEALYSYLRTLNPKGDAGPSVKWIKKPNPKYDLQKDPIAKWVKDFPRLERVDMGETVSARAYQVGLPGDISYTFDPRNMAVAQIWDGPFMRKNDQVGRGKGGADQGHKSRDYGVENLFQPFDAKGKLVDLTFASPARLFDEKQSAEFLADKSDFLAVVDAFPAKFLGVDTPKQKVPTFKYMVGDNKVALEVNISKTLQLDAKFNFELKSEQVFVIPEDKLKNVKVSHGKISGGKWTVPAGKHHSVTFSATLPKLEGDLYTSDIQATESYAPQELVWKESVWKDPKKKLNLPPGYRVEDGTPPTDPFGRELVFEPLGIEFHNGEAFVSTRTAGVWKVVDGKWHLFAEGTYESIGLVVNSEKDIVIGEKAGLTRLTDNDGDHWAESRENITDKFRFNGDYHEYLHGPIKHNGKYLFSLNLGNEVAGMYKANGRWMGTVGGLRGWMLSSDEKGDTKIFASGFRSPAGLALSPQNEIVYTENQGEYVGTSKMFKVKKGLFYGNPNGLLDIPGMNVDSPEIKWDAVKDTRELPILLLPHGEVMNAPGSPEFLTDKITFGPFQGQMFLGDQLQSNIYRIDTQVVDGQEQAVAIPFAEGLKSGAMRLRFNPADSSLWIGQTGRGWRSRGGNTYAFQRIVYDPKVAVDAIKTVKVTNQGFDVHFVQPQSGADEAKNIVCSSWYYLNSSEYGSRRQGEREEKVLKTSWNDAKTICSITLDNFEVKKEKGSDSSRVYRINLANTAFGKKHDAYLAKAYYTLHKIPTQ
jgi:hypothetical protein